MFSIVARRPDGSEFHAFHWTRDAQRGIIACFQTAIEFGVEIVGARAIDAESDEARAIHAATINAAE